MSSETDQSLQSKRHFLKYVTIYTTILMSAIITEERVTAALLEQLRSD